MNCILAKMNNESFICKICCNYIYWLGFVVMSLLKRGIMFTISLILQRSHDKGID